MSCNLLQPRARDNLRGSDTLSEVSESGTANSGWTSLWDSREDLRDFVTKMGFKDVSDLHQDRFKVDRKKLEQMLSGDDEAPMSADIFFEQIMSDTGTYITWPSKLKIGAKSKKDPHVRIAGRPEDVQVAKDRIMTVLDTRCNRVTMKMDVSYTDHSHIIGKGGLSIKRVMEETHCHVHFPDSNRSNPTEKNNQVSIAGNIQCVEFARSRIRQKSPVVFGFELPIMSQSIEPTNPCILKIQEEYNVQVMLRTRPKLHATLVLVKGVEWEVDQVKRATLQLVDYMCENLANQIPIQMSMEISPHHHPMVTGKNHGNLKEIMRITGAQIMFPDAQDPNIPSLKKSNVTITGNIHNVYAARQLLTGSLPLLLMFDLPENTFGLPMKQDQISEVESKYDVTINMRMKAKHNTMSCIIKGSERAASNIYKARNVILNTDAAPITADIPSTYNVPNIPPTFQNTEAPSPFNPQPQHQHHQPISPMLSPLVSPTWNYLQPQFNQPPGCLGVLQQPPMMYNNLFPQMASTGYSSSGQYSRGGSASPSSTPSPIPSLTSSPRNMSPSYQRVAMSSTSSASPIPSPLASPRNASPNYQRLMDPNENLDMGSGLREGSTSSEYNQNTMDKRQEQNQCLASEYEQKRLSGFKAMKTKPTSGYRHPNSTWLGYGISHTSPGSIFTADKGNQNKDVDDVWKTPTPTAKQIFDFNFASTSVTPQLNTSNYLDHTPTNVVNRLTTAKWPDLGTMFTALGLEKYLGLFSSHEIDLTTFSSMSDKDLIEIGITAFGARRKMLLAISELNKRSNTFPLAPGAERKSSSSSIPSFSPTENW